VTVHVEIPAVTGLRAGARIGAWAGVERGSLRWQRHGDAAAAEGLTAEGATSNRPVATIQAALASMAPMAKWAMTRSARSV
jgi:hypothetical protein